MKRVSIFRFSIFFVCITVALSLSFVFGLYSGAKKTVIYRAIYTVKKSIEKESDGKNKQILQENKFPWPNGKIAAVSLTFDDARTSQSIIGVPLLNEYDVKATFYVQPENVERHLDKWKQAVLDGHEIGNHTSSHPCSGNLSFSRDNPLEDYNIERIEYEINQSNKAIERLFGIKPVSFAYPCGHSFVGRGKEHRSYEW